MAVLPKAYKNFGQHFLNDSNIINQITEDFKDIASSIIEIGPGPGILTEYLVAHDLPFHVIEKDRRFPEYLKTYLPEEKILLADALEIDIDSFINERDLLTPIWLVSNLPYNVSVPLLINFMQSKKIDYLTLMFQKEVGDKILPKTKKNGSGSLMALCQTYFEVSELCQVPPTSFTPPPKVDSVVLSFKRRETPTISLDQFKSFEKFLRNLFQMRRKQVGKVLKSSYPIEVIGRALEECHLEKTLRAEAFSLDDVQNLYKAMDC